MDDAPGHQKKKSWEPPPIHLSLSYDYTSTTILFGGPRRADLRRHATFAGTEIPLGSGWSVRFGAGGILGGELDPSHIHGDFGPGVTGYVGGAKSIVDEKKYVPFVQLSLTLSGSRVGTKGPLPDTAPSFTAFDLRAGAMVGKSFGPFVPYAVGRVFGGPVYYKFLGHEETGTDLHKYQVGGGFAIATPSHVLDVFVEGIALGELGVSAGLGTTF